MVGGQIFLFDNLQLRGMLDSFVAPCVYIFYILMLPISVSKINLLAASFVLGLTVDLLSGTLGQHTAACVLIGFIRPSLIKSLTVGKENTDKGLRPSIYVLGLFRFLFYALILTFTFHLALFFLEIFTLHQAYFTLLRTLLSSAAAVAIMIILEIFFEKKDKRYP
jgi:rod shape-determining protein MreD